MRRAIVGMCLVWVAMILACTGAGGLVFDMPGEFSLCRIDAHDYHLFYRSGGFVGGHITHVGFDDRHILLRRDVAEYPSYTQYRLTGKIEYWIVEIATAKRHGPLTEDEFVTARAEMGIRPEVRLEPSDSQAARQQQ